MTTPQSTHPLVIVGVTSSQTCLVLRGRLRALRMAGFRVVMVSSPGPLLDALAASEGIQAVAIPMVREISPMNDLVALIRLWMLLRRLKPDLVEFSTPKAGLLGLVAARFCRVPHRIYLLRGLKMETATGIKRRVLAAAERLTARCAQLVIANSESLRHRAIELGVVPEPRILLLGNGTSRGVNIARFSPGPSQVRERMSLAADVPVLGFVGRLTRDKGVPELLDAFDLVLRHIPEARLLLVGWFDQAEDALPAALRRRILRHPRILLTGFVEETEEYYRAMDLLVLPTWREGFPNAVLEAAATGIPVVTTMATGARDSVLPEVTGLLVPPGYPQAIAEAVLHLLHHPDRMRQMGQAARAWVLEHFTDAHVLSLTIKFYRALLDQTSCEPPTSGGPGTNSDSELPNSRNVPQFGWEHS